MWLFCQSDFYSDWHYMVPSMVVAFYDNHCIANWQTKLQEKCPKISTGGGRRIRQWSWKSCRPRNVGIGCDNQHSEEHFWLNNMLLYENIFTTKEKISRPVRLAVCSQSQSAENAFCTLQSSANYCIFLWGIVTLKLAENGPSAGAIPISGQEVACGQR